MTYYTVRNGETMDMKKLRLAPVAVLMVFALTMVGSAAINSTQITADITAALDIFWLIPESIVDHFGTLITLVLFGAIMMLITIVLLFLKKVLTTSLDKKIGGGE
jgi:hypothetical protein